MTKVPKDEEFPELWLELVLVMVLATYSADLWFTEL